MIKKMIPSYYAKKIFLIDYHKLLQLNINNIFFDLDNTLTAYYETLPNEELLSFINQLTQLGFRIFIISNNHEPRVAKFARALKLDYLCEARKPSAKRLLLFINKFGLNHDNCVLIGDQLLTDVICANKARIYSVLVEPYIKKDLPITRINRLIDKLIRRYFVKKNLLLSIEKEKEIYG